MKLRILLIFMIVGWATTASAQDASLKKAQEAFDQAQVQYLQGNYDAAAEGFKTAYGGEGSGDDDQEAAASAAPAA